MSLYARTRNPFQELVVCVTVIVKAYLPMVFDVHMKPKFWNGSIHIFNYAKRAKACLKKEHWEIVKKSFITNGYFFHPESILMCAYLSPLSPQRTKARALKLILKARETYVENTENVRAFILPTADQLNFDTNDFFEVLRYANFYIYSFTYFCTSLFFTT